MFMNKRIYKHNMLTRSQTKRVELPVEIDFDGASRAWLSNKNRLSNGVYEYIETAEQVKPKYALRTRTVAHYAS